MDWRRVARVLRPEQSPQPAPSHQAPSQIAQADDVYSAGLARPISSHEAILVHPEDAIERPSGDAGHQGRVGAEGGGPDPADLPSIDQVARGGPGHRLEDVIVVDPVIRSRLHHKRLPSSGEVRYPELAGVAGSIPGGGGA